MKKEQVKYIIVMCDGIFICCIFRWLAETGGIEARELARTFNCGIGMLVIAAPEAVEDITAALSDAGETVYCLGALEARAGDTPSVILENLASWSR